MPHVTATRIMFHGGEPMLAPVKDMYDVYHATKEVFEDTSFGMQTNLVYPLTEEKRKFFLDVLLEYGFGTSWDYDIRFTNPNHLKLYEENSKILNFEDGHHTTMIVSITKKLIENKEPIEIMEYAKSLGYSFILFERITSDGNAKQNSDIIPTNLEQDAWLHKMWNQCIEHKTYEWIGNMLMSELATALVNRQHNGNRCRNCEQSLLTINADGTIAGCPNTAPVDYWGHIDHNINDMLASKKRLEIIGCETQRDPRCYTCPAFEVCNGDCHQLSWDGDVCAAPKSIWKEALKESDYETYKKLILR
jgi:radical SAM protein with 4Fe4S-binding SPASM domain